MSSPFLATLAVAAALAIPQVADGPITLREKRAVGDVTALETVSRIQLSLVATVAGQAQPPSSTDTEERSAYRETVLALEPGGRPSAIRRAYSVARTIARAQGEVTEKVSPLQGKTVTIKRVGGKVQVTAPGAALPAKEVEDLQSALTGVVDDLLPAAPVNLRERWTASCPALARLAGPGGTATVTGVAEERVTFAGRPCVRARVEVEVAGKPQAGRIVARFVLEGDLHYATDIRRTLKVDVQGPVTVKADMEEQGMRIAVTGTGQAALRMVARHEKLGGQPPPR